LSTLTKVLIVLLTVFSVFLCGIVVTYVGNADSYKRKHEEVQSQLQAAKAKLNAAQEDSTKKAEDADLQKKQFEDQISAISIKMTELQGKLDEAEREKSLLLQKVNSWASITKDFYQTTDKQGQLLQNTLGELDKLQQEQVKQRKQLEETTASAIEKMAIITTLQQNSKRLLEEKKDLENKLNQFLRQYGKVVVAAEPVTARKAAVMPAGAGMKDIGLGGQITAVDLKNSLAEISIGSADGVKQDMKFHVTRGDKFICDILILDVDAEKAVGILELMQDRPKVGDKVSTNL
jgi:predicted  nucleic acid-binding Zn-ribbon protein